MDFQIKSIKKQGFSLLEMLIVITIVAIIASVSTLAYTSFKAHENLEAGIITVVEALRHAQSNAQSGKADSSWGLKFTGDSGTIFKGISYIGRDGLSDQLLYFPGGVEAGGLSEIVFAKLTGDTQNTGIITLTNSYGTKDISINEKGTITY